MVRDRGQRDPGCLFNREGDADGLPAEGSRGRLVPPATPSMAAPWCRPPPLPIWRRVARSSLAGSRPYLYSAGGISALSVRVAAAMR